MKRPSSGFGRDWRCAMRNVVVSLAACSFIVGCGFSSAEVSVGDSVTVHVHHPKEGRTAVNVSVGSKDCRTSALTVAFADVAARIAAC